MVSLSYMLTLEPGVVSIQIESGGGQFKRSGDGEREYKSNRYPSQWELRERKEWAPG